MTQIQLLGVKEKSRRELSVYLFCFFKDMSAYQKRIAINVVTQYSRVTKVGLSVYWLLI